MLEWAGGRKGAEGRGGGGGVVLFIPVLPTFRLFDRAKCLKTGLWGVVHSPLWAGARFPGFSQTECLKTGPIVGRSPLSRLFTNQVLEFDEGLQQNVSG